MYFGRRIALLRVREGSRHTRTFPGLIGVGPIPFTEDCVRCPIPGLGDSHELASCFVGGQCAFHLL